MDNFIWNDRFNIGVEEIDEQHRLYLGYVNDCYTAVCHSDRARVTDATINGLKAYADTHFRFEEALMKKVRYPDLERHAGEHAYFEEQVVKRERARADGEKSDARSSCTC